MKVNLVKATAMRSLGTAALSGREQCEALLYRQSLGHFIAAAWRHADTILDERLRDRLLTALR